MERVIRESHATVQCDKLVELLRVCESCVGGVEAYHYTFREQRLSQILMQNAVQLRVELASLMELEKFVKATYTLEGDGHLILALSSYSRAQFPSYPRCGSRTASSEHLRPSKMVPVWPKGVFDAYLSVFSEHFGE